MSLMSTNVVISAQTGEVNQKFMFDPTTMTIKTMAMANRSLNVASSGRSTNLEVNSTNGQSWQIFKFQGERIVNC